MSKIQIINSKGHWAMGCFGKAERIDFVIKNVLSKAGFKITVNEISSVSELEILLDKMSSDTLIWTNAYYVDTENGNIDWLNTYIENRGLPLVGSGAKVLKNLLNKDVCQTILSHHNIPIPIFSILKRDNASQMDTFFSNSKITYPLVVKATAECLSLGISLVNNYKEAIEEGHKILRDYPKSHIIAEEFLPNNDITCGYIELGEDILLMPTHYGYTDKPGKNHIFNFDDRFEINNPNRERSVVSEPILRNQLKTSIPKIVKILGVRDMTRIDGRPDKEGNLRYFDINGFPGLSCVGIISDIVAQTFLFFPKYPQIEVYQALINTVVLNALIRNNLSIPELLHSHNLFTLESDLVIKTNKKISN